MALDDRKVLVTGVVGSVIAAICCLIPFSIASISSGREMASVRCSRSLSFWCFCFVVVWRPLARQ